MTKQEYTEYINSQEWRDKRERYFKVFEKKCVACEYTSETDIIILHHRTYHNVGEEKYKDLIPLCWDCHGRLHDFMFLSRPQSLKRKTREFIRDRRRQMGLKGFRMNAFYRKGKKTDDYVKRLLKDY